MTCLHAHGPFAESLADIHEVSAEMRLNQLLSQFDEGRLDTEEIGRGMHLCFKNAEALIEDARFLREKRPARSIGLAVLAMEEIGKIFLLCAAAGRSADDPVEWAVIRREFSLFSHQEKQGVFAAYGSAFLVEWMRDKGEELYKESVPGGIIPLLDRMKQLGFYVDSFQGAFVSPEEFGIANAKWADWLIRVASERIDSIRRLHRSEQDSVAVAKAAAVLGKALGGKTYEEIRNIIFKALRSPGDPGARDRPSGEDAR
jgi:AbiV family abortive infection protein